MFISRAEKSEIELAIRSLQARVRDLEIEVTWAKKKALRKQSVLIKTEGAPWGLKKDGNPRKRPGRPLQSMEVSA